MPDKMLILSGLIDTIPPSGHPDPRGLLDRKSADAYAATRGYVPVELDVSDHFAGLKSRQVLAALTKFRLDKDISAIYGFSGGAYNLPHVIRRLTSEEKKRIRLVVAIGAPTLDKPSVSGTWELAFVGNSPKGHMDGPRYALTQWLEKHPHPVLSAGPIKLGTPTLSQN
jgi:hypothetical protein